MRFRSDWQAPVVWISLSALQIIVAALRLHKYHWHDGYACFQLLCWTFIFSVWGLTLIKSWQFEKDSLVLKRFPLPDLNIPYTSITSIDWGAKGRYILLTLRSPIFLGMKKQIVTVHDTPGFLSEMEKHVTPDVLHI